MYSTVLVLHSIFRWLVLLALSYAIVIAYRGYTSKSSFSSWDNHIRHWTATIAHIQLVFGILVYIKSPIVQSFFSTFSTSFSDWNLTFFGLLHPILMLTAIVVITVGSAKAKRKETDSEKYQTMLIWFVLALIFIFIAIPWPFSPLANRPYLRTF